MDKLKFYVGLAGTALTAAADVVPDPYRKWVQAGLVIVTAVGVWLTPNLEGVNALRKKLTAAQDAGRL